MDVIRSLPKIAARLSRQAKVAALSAADLQAECPWLGRQIVRDAETPELFDFWGSSCNLDELAGESIVEPGVLTAIGELAGVPLTGPVVHAGLQHTYGYLLSTILTPYGYKRDRWLSPQLELGFGLPTDVLGPNPSQGTLLANATVLAGAVAFRGDDKSTEKLGQILPAAAEAVRKFDVSQIEQTRIVESLSLRNAAGRFCSLRIRTDLMQFPNHVQNCQEDHLLVYSVEDSDDSGARLITLFPVAPQFVAELTGREQFGPAMPIRTRFNAFVPGITGQMHKGRRTLQRFSP